MKTGSGSRFSAGSKLPRVLAPPHGELWPSLLWDIVLLNKLDFLVKFQLSTLRSIGYLRVTNFGRVVFGPENLRVNDFGWGKLTSEFLGVVLSHFEFLCMHDGFHRPHEWCVWGIACHTYL